MRSLRIKYNPPMEKHRMLLGQKLSPRMVSLTSKLRQFVAEECIPAEIEYDNFMNAKAKGDRFSEIPPVMEKLKKRAKKLGLWNLFLPKEYPESPGLTNLEYAHLCEILGESALIAPEACNCSAPDTGNMEVLAKYGTIAQKKRWLRPLMDGTIRSAFLMTEPEVASSDARNICTSIRRSGDEYIINGKKWWSSGANDPRTEIFIVMGKIEGETIKGRHAQSMILLPRRTAGVKIERDLTIILGPGRGFEIAQGRLGPGRIHHCMRCIGLAERAIRLMVDRVTCQDRKTFGKLLVKHGTILKDISDMRIELEQARLLVLHAALMIDTVGSKEARKEIAMIKIVVPTMTCNVLDRAIQAHGGMGVCQDTFLARAFATVRTLRIADGPDEVHRLSVAKLEVKEQLKRKSTGAFIGHHLQQITFSRL